MGHGNMASVGVLPSLNENLSLNHRTKSVPIPYSAVTTLHYFIRMEAYVKTLFLVLKIVLLCLGEVLMPWAHLEKNY